MTRWALLGALALLSCTPTPAEEGTAAAHVEDWTLEEDRLAELLLLAQPFPLERGAVRELARHWVGVSALARRASDGADLLGEEAFRESMWLELREALLATEREDRLGAAVPEPGEEEFREGEYVLLAHVLRGVGPETSPAERDLQRRTAERILAGLVTGGSWQDAVAESEDPATRERSGLLGVVRAGELPAPLAEAAVRLEPGQVSSVVGSSRGFHILYRPRWDEVADLWPERLRERLLAEADAASARSLLQERGFTPAEDALAFVREAAEEPLFRLDSDRVAGSWDGGELAGSTVARYVAALPAASREEMSRAADPALASFLEEVARREIRIGDARARGLAVEDDLLARLRDQHAEEVRGWIETLGVSEGDPGARDAVAVHMERAVSRRLDVRPIPPLLEAWLLDGLDWTVVDARVSAAAGRARAMIESAGAPAGTSGTPR